MREYQFSQLVLWLGIMNKTNEDFLEEIEELKDYIHNLKIDLREARDIANSKSFDVIEHEKIITDLRQEIVNLNSTISKLECESDKQEECIAKELEKVKMQEEEIKSKKDNYKKSLCMWETVRQGNYKYFTTDAGLNFLHWATSEFNKLWRQ